MGKPFGGSPQIAFPETLLQARGSGMGCFRPGIARERCGSRPRQRRTPARPAAHIHARLCRAGGPQLAGKGPVSRFIPALELDRSLRGEGGGVGRKLIQTVPCQAGLACRSVHAATTAGDAPWHQSGGQPHRPTRVRKSVRLVPHSAGRVPLSLLSDKMLQHSGRSSGACRGRHATVFGGSTDCSAISAHRRKEAAKHGRRGTQACPLRGGCPLQALRPLPAQVLRRIGVIRPPRRRQAASQAVPAPVAAHRGGQHGIASTSALRPGAAGLSGHKGQTPLPKKGCSTHLRAPHMKGTAGRLAGRAPAKEEESGDGRRAGADGCAPRRTAGPAPRRTAGPARSLARKPAGRAAPRSASRGHQQRPERRRMKQRQRRRRRKRVLPHRSACWST